MRANSKRAWRQAVLRRDPAYDQSFVFAVTTTAIYCRPSCPSRRPRPDHVVFFKSPGEARREGFRACLRCRPDDPAGHPGGILAACEFIARHAGEPLSLKRIARAVNWSPSHLQRVFRRVLGVSPKEYVRRLRFESLGRQLRSGRKIAPALYAAGFGSSSRLYERATVHLGMSPARAARKGAGMSIAYDVVDCPLGRALIAATTAGICAVEFGTREATLVSELRGRFPGACITKSPDLLRFAKARLRAVFADDLRDAQLPLDVRATAFQAQVWESLRAIPRGRTRTYAEIARSIGRPGSARAVAGVCASNPVALLIPCHRVIGSNGSLGGYRWGIERKKALLSREKPG